MKITNYFTEGNIGLIDGTMGSGKTDFACTFIEKLIQEKHFQIITNIIFLKKEENIMSCSTAKKLLLNLVDMDKTVVVLDEAGLWFSSKEGMMKRNRQLEKLIMLIRKFRSNLIFIAQSYRYIPPIVKDFYNVRMSKNSKKNMIIEIQGTDNEKKKILEIGKVPPTSLSFDTYSIPFFSFDTDLEELFVAVADIPSNQIKDKMKQELKKMEEGGKKIEKVEDITNTFKTLQKSNQIRILVSLGFTPTTTLYDIYGDYCYQILNDLE